MTISSVLLLELQLCTKQLKIMSQIKTFLSLCFINIAVFSLKWHTTWQQSFENVPYRKLLLMDKWKKMHSVYAFEWLTDVHVRYHISQGYM